MRRDSIIGAFAIAVTFASLAACGADKPPVTATNDPASAPASAAAPSLTPSPTASGTSAPSSATPSATSTPPVAPSAMPPPAATPKKAKKPADPRFVGTWSIKGISGTLAYNSNGRLKSTVGGTTCTGAWWIEAESLVTDYDDGQSRCVSLAVRWALPDKNTIKFAGGAATYTRVDANDDTSF